MKFCFMIKGENVKCPTVALEKVCFSEILPHFHLIIIEDL